MQVGCYHRGLQHHAFARYLPKFWANLLVPSSGLSHPRPHHENPEMYKNEEWNMALSLQRSRNFLQNFGNNGVKLQIFNF